jgi:hypothetical protein
MLFKSWGYNKESEKRKIKIVDKIYEKNALI